MSCQSTTARGPGRAARRRRRLEPIATGFAILGIALAAVVLANRWLAHRDNQPRVGATPATDKVRTGNDFLAESAARTFENWVKSMPRMTGRAPRMGDTAPDFALPSLAGGEEVRLSSFRGRRPVVLAFGSFGCNLFAGDVRRLNDLHRACQDRAEFCFVYITDAAHATPLAPAAVVTAPWAEPPADRLARIRGGVKALQIAIPCLVAPLRSEVEITYQAFPRRLLLVGVDGRIRYDAGRGLAGSWDFVALEDLLRSLPVTAPVHSRPADGRARRTGRSRLMPTTAGAGATAAPGDDAAPARGSR
jgi:hypothetical protein